MAEDFLASRTDGRRWVLPDRVDANLTPIALFLGTGRQPLEVAVASSRRTPGAALMRELWRGRHGNTPSPLLLVVLHPSPDGTRASVCGPVPPSPAPVLALPVDQVERIAETALAEPNRHAAVRFLQEVLPEAESELPGIRNVGLVATHELIAGVPARTDWVAACTAGAPLLARRGRDLVESLGFSVEERGVSTYVLRAGEVAAAVAVFLEADETPEAENISYGFISPVSAALARADAEQLPYVLLTRGSEVRIYATRSDVGVGRRGRAETFVAVNLGLVPSEKSGYLPLIFSAGALRPGGTLSQILSDSKDFAVDLGGRLRERVYNVVVPSLAGAIARHRQVTAAPASDGELPDLYEQALTILFRLLFVAYAEDKDLLPYRTSGAYQQNALKTLARQLTDLANKGALAFDPQSTLLWARIRELARAVDQGRPAWSVPAYNGGLFSSNPDVSGAGARLANLELTDAEFGPALAALLIDSDDDGMRGPVDFRSLSVREFGTIYEGLLESGLAIASTDLSVDDDGTYVPARAGTEPIVSAGQIYLHNSSGARKSSGTYFTPPFAVEHLLEQALEPAMDAHLHRLESLLESGDDHQAAEGFFDFRCADLAMGSGHFLVAAVDRIERRLSTFLAEHRMPGVYAELARLRAAAADMLGEDAASVAQIETATLIRRQVARRCVYGVDQNPIAVELARLALWIHTFVPGLPLSYLSHNLVAGDSLTGVGTVDEAVRALDPDADPDQPTLWRQAILAWIGRASASLQRLGRSTDATMAEVQAARADQHAAVTAVEPAQALFDVLVAVRLGEVTAPVLPDDNVLLTDHGVAALRSRAKELNALHFPVVFPEVFLRERDGFDVVVGNPPWDKVRFEEQQFWVSRVPGLNRVPANQRSAAIGQLRREHPTDAEIEVSERERRELMQRLIDGGYELQGRGSHGHHDFAKVFLERTLALLGTDGHLGLVLPRAALVLGGWRDLRQALLDHGTVLTVQARNRRKWLFDIHAQLMIVFLTRRAATGSQEEVAATIWPAVTSQPELTSAGNTSTITLTRADLAQLSDTQVIPWFNGRADLPVFEVMRGYPRLGRGDGWIHAIADSSRWDFSGSGPHRRFVGAAGEESWGVLMTRHVDAYRIATEEPFPRHVHEPVDLEALGLGVVVENGAARYADDHPAIIYRYPTMNDNSRTLIATALPDTGFVYSKGYVHGLRLLSPSNTEHLLALLAYLNTYTADWWTRRFVDRHMTQPVLANLPLPTWTEGQRRDAAAIASEFLRRRGTSRLAGGRDLVVDERLSIATDEALTVSMEWLTAAGFGFGRSQMDAILEDFSAEGCPPALRNAIVTGGIAT